MPAQLNMTDTSGRLLSGAELDKKKSLNGHLCPATVFYINKEINKKILLKDL